MSGRVVIKWTEAAKSRVCALYEEGRLSGTEIAALIRAEHGLQVSKSAVIGIAFRAGLSDPGGELGPYLSAARAVLDARPGNPIPHEERLRRRREARSRIAYARAKPVRASKPRARPVAKAAAAPKPKPAKAVEVGIPASLRVAIWEIRDGQCRYIADDPKGGAATYCGHVAQHGAVWCPGHFRMCTVPSRRPVNAWIPEHRRAA
ncbi:GcrA family cell cycle regulator [Methylobacterium pseudosasicola]|uniref:GcrA cell cycle regulator n=1 Tax=Methylobacterium pseudosasicola TaxID=582667 RepID=A0A1I4U7E7_9HYPH|nr:GcrA family cell cycle regulator [Methylobacterium pseudosasicola]SFM84741.1 hypothetical protein SAMN05192568_10648 [Methylobacterium pseudosasicola]